jgi:hypothetical protein
MAWAWYQIKEVTETLKNSVPDETTEVDLENIGIETIRFIRGFGESVGIIFKGFLLFPNMNSRNPFTKNDEVGAMIKEGFYWVGINEDA